MGEKQIIREIDLDYELKILDNLSNGEITNSYIFIKYECLDDYYKTKENALDYIYGELLDKDNEGDKYFQNSRIEVILFMKEKVSAEIKYEFERDELFIKKYFIDNIDIENTSSLIEAIKDNIPSLGNLDQILINKREDNMIFENLKKELLKDEEYPYLSKIMTENFKINRGETNEN